MPEKDDFTAMATAALGTDDPERIAALKEAIMSCMGAEEEGEYEEEPAAEGAGGGDLAMIFGGGKK